MDNANIDRTVRSGWVVHLVMGLLVTVSLIVSMLVAGLSIAQAAERRSEQRFGVVTPVGSSPVRSAGPLTVTTTLRFPSDEDAVERVWLAALAVDESRSGQHLALLWEKQAGRFGRWELKLVSDAGLVAKSAGQRLSVSFPEPGQVYVATLSYDPAAGVVSILLSTSGTASSGGLPPASTAGRVYAGELHVAPQPFPLDLYLWAGAECGAGASDGCGTAISLLRVVDGYVPVGASAGLVRPGRSDRVVHRHIDRRQEWAVRLETLHLPHDGEVRLLARTGEDFSSKTVLFRSAAGDLAPGAEMAFDARALPAGKIELVVEYTVGAYSGDSSGLPAEAMSLLANLENREHGSDDLVTSHSWETASLFVDAGIVSMRFDESSFAYDAERSAVFGSLLLETDGHIDGLTVSLSGEASFDRWTDDPWITAIERVDVGPIPLEVYAGALSGGAPVAFDFTFPLPATGIAGRLDLQLRPVATYPHGVSAQIESDFRKVYLMPEVPSLAELFQAHFDVGFATDTIPREAHDLLAYHFNVVTTGNSLKWDAVQSRPGSFDFVRPDALVAWASQRGIDVIGHTLVWHQQTPAWVFQGEGGEPPTRELLLERMRDHIHTVVGRYCGRIRGWDVVNEALEENGSLRDSPWQRIVGDEYIEWAFRFAHEACPSAELYYNDYNLTNPTKRQGAIRIVRRLQEQGIPIHGVGEQGHFDLYTPSTAELRATIQALSGLGVKVLITELDMSAYAWSERRNLYAGGFPPELARRQAQRYADFFSIFQEHAGVIDRVTFWGTTDQYSWKNDFPEVGRTDYPLLFDREGHYKPAFWAVAETGRARVQAGF